MAQSATLRHTLMLMQTMRPRLVELTSLRFFAAFWVVLYHTQGFVHNVRQDPAWVQSLLDSGYTAVSFFFVLSGFILAVVYLPGTGQVSVAPFYRARFARIYPLYLITLFADTPILLSARIAKYGAATAVAKTAVTFGANLLMLQAWVPVFLNIDGPNWSLSVETFFYLLFPLLGVWLWRIRASAGLWMAALLWLGTIAFLVALNRRVSEDVLKFEPLLHLNEFVVGVVLGRFWQVWRQGREDGVLSPFVGPWLAGAGILLLLGASLFGNRIPVPLLNDGLLAPIWGLLIFGCAAGRSSWTHWLSLRWLEVLGESSYGLYLWHMVIWHYVVRAGLDGSLLFYPVYLLGCIGLSVASHFWVERPAREWLLGKRKMAAAV